MKGKNRNNCCVLIAHTNSIEYALIKSKSVSEAFGTVVHASHLPGTPMIDMLSENSRSFASDGSLNKERSESSERRKILEMKKLSPDFGQRFKDAPDFNLHGDDKSFSYPTKLANKQDQELRKDPESVFFRDGRRRIDIVLSFEEQLDGVMTEDEAKQRDQRKVFQANLIKEGLDIEIEDKRQSFDEKTFFVKIHLPSDTEAQHAEVMNLKLPLKRFITLTAKNVESETDGQKENVFEKIRKFATKCFRSLQAFTEYDYSLIDKEPTYFSATASGNREDQFVIKERMTEFNSAQRSMIAYQILLRTKFDDGEKCGIRWLINDGTYHSCFPLHDGHHEKRHSSGAMFERRVRKLIIFIYFHC